MIKSSIIAKAVALTLATVVLVSAMHLTTSGPHIEMEGGGQKAKAKMGSMFEDMTAGTLTSETTRDLAPSPPVSQTQALEPTPPPTEHVVSEAPLNAPVPEPTVPSLPSAQVPPSTAVPLASKPTLTSPPAPTAIKPNNTLPGTVVASQEPASTVPPQSMRPQRRDPVLAAKAEAARPKPKAAKAKPKVTKVAKAKPQTKRTAAPKGNSKQNNTKGAATGTTRKAAAKTQGKAKKQRGQSGNAAASNYPGKVMRRISRVRKPRVSSRGTAVISFSISSGGGLSRVSVARSSGSRQLDSAAVKVIQQAAPFPAPPTGAQRQFSIRIKGS